MRKRRQVVDNLFWYTAAYRFFPLLLIFSILLITFSNRDFGPILTAERKSLPIVPRNLINTRSPTSNKKAGILCPSKGTGAEIGSDSETEKVELRGSAGSGADTPQVEYQGKYIFSYYSSRRV